MDSKAKQKQFLALKKAADGQPVEKNLRTYNLNPMPIEKLLNPAPEERKKKKKAEKERDWKNEATQKRPAKAPSAKSGPT